MMGIGHFALQAQFNFQNKYQTQYRQNLSHGGTLRQRRSGRFERPLSAKHPVHLVLKADKKILRQRTLRSHKNFQLITHITQKYALRFHVKVEQCSIQFDHIHLLIRTNRRSQFQNFFRVLAGQIAQEFQKQSCLVTDTPKNEEGKLKNKNTQHVKQKSTKRKKLWIHRPFTRVVKGWRAYKIIRNYIQLNEQEALGRIRYQKQRLRGLSSADWKVLWGN